MDAPSVYLAGPVVFAADGRARLEARRAVCAGLGLVAMTPFDPWDDPPAWADWPVWKRIAARNEARIRACAGVIADLSPFRGPSADVGTVYEVGFARALGRPVVAFSTDASLFVARSVAFVGAAARRDGDGWRDGEGMELESFGCRDNLMIDGGVEWIGERGTSDELFRLAAGAVRQRLLF